jgi:hypothetical protein
MGQQTLVYLGFAVIGVTLVAAGVRATLRSRRTASDLATTAAAQGWTYQAKGRAPADVGVIFDEPNRGFYRNVITGSTASTPFVAFEYDGPKNGVHGFVLVNLPKYLPTLEVRPAGSIRSALRGTEYGLPLVRFESADFNARFSVQSPDAKFASDLITPRLMEALMAAPPLNWRIMDGVLVSWSNSALTALQILSTVPTLRLIVDAIPGFVVADHAPAVPPAASQGYIVGTPALAHESLVPSAPPAGWYPDPTTPGMARWWNGSIWTANHAKIQAR